MARGDVVETIVNSEIRWYVLSLRYLRAASAAPAFEEAGMTAFVPPVVTNMLFVRSSAAALEDFISGSSLRERMGFMRSRATGAPIVVRDPDMDLFIRICKAAESPIVMSEMPDLKIGDRVRILGGPLKGAEGNVVRMRKNKRVLLNIGEVLWVATDYIRPELLQVLDGDSR